MTWNFIKKTQFSGLTFYLVNALKSGYLQDVLVNVNLPIKKPDDLIVKVSFKSTEFEYDDNFASVQNGHGIVDVNAERTIVLLDNATTAGNKLNFTRVDVDHHKNIVNVNSALSGTPFGIASVLLPKVELQNYTHLVNATMDARINLKLDLKCKNIFECSSFDVISDVNFLMKI